MFMNGIHQLFESTKLVESLARSLKHGLVALCFDATSANVALMRWTELALSERLFSTGLLDAVIEQIHISPDRFVKEIRQGGS
eukprot:tig00000605_g2511.t1